MGDNDENHLIAERRAKLARLRERGVAFPNDFRRNALAGDLLTAYGEKSGASLDAAAIRVSVAGRMRGNCVQHAPWTAPCNRPVAGLGHD